MGRIDNHSMRDNPGIISARAEDQPEKCKCNFHWNGLDLLTSGKACRVKRVDFTANGQSKKSGKLLTPRQRENKVER